jgi:hypothetical protein
LNDVLSTMGTPVAESVDQAPVARGLVRRETVCRRPEPSTWVTAGMGGALLLPDLEYLHHERDRVILLEHLPAPTARMVGTTPAA